jgi:2-keto-4-pentenoate hydratase/2-oxohepta-3-ene-1,7-dioic acid hydratase in catechol pathway
MVPSGSVKLVRFDEDARPGVLDGNEIADISGIYPSMEALIGDGSHGVQRVAAGLDSVPRIPGARLRAPLQPASLRDFLAFEDHARAGARRRGEELNPIWYERPIYYKGNHRQIIGPDEPLPWPAWTEQLDFELELACVVGPNREIFGYTIMNDWSARDMQRAEMAVRLGPARSKDFATSLGPWLVTADEFDPVYGVAMHARVDDETWFDTKDARMYWTFEQMIAYVAEGETIYPGDVYGSGTAYGGCGLDQDRWIARGQTVELEIDGLGVLRNPIV